MSCQPRFVRRRGPALEVADFIMHAVDRQARQNLKKARRFRAGFLRGRSQAHQLHGSRVRLLAGYRSCVTCLNFARAGAWNLAALCRRMRPCTHRATTTSTCLLPVQNHSCSENAPPVAVDDTTLLGIVRRLSRVLAFSAGISRKCPCGGTGRRARLKIEFRKECWFDSGQGHQNF